jgi:hypothetical protein
MKKYLLGLSALVLAISFSAFTTYSTVKHSLAGEKWFKFNGNDPADLNDPSRYSLDLDGSFPTICTTTASDYRCEIYAVPQSVSAPVVPDLSTIASITKRPTPGP